MLHININRRRGQHQPLMLPLPLTWVYTQNFLSPNSILTLFIFFGSLLLSKGGGLAPKLFVEVDFGNVTSRKCYSIRQVLIAWLSLSHSPCTAVKSICWLVIPLRRIVGKPDKTLNKIIVLKPVGRAPLNLSGKHAIAVRMISQLFWRTLLVVLLSKLGHSSTVNVHV